MDYRGIGCAWRLLQVLALNLQRMPSLSNIDDLLLCSPMTASIYFPAIPTLTKEFHESTENLVGSALAPRAVTGHDCSCAFELDARYQAASLIRSLQNLTVTMYMVMQGVGKSVALLRVVKELTMPSANVLGDAQRSLWPASSIHRLYAIPCADLRRPCPHADGCILAVDASTLSAGFRKCKHHRPRYARIKFQSLHTF